MHRTHSLRLLLVIGFLGFSLSRVQAEIYRWTDENGVTHYSNVTIPDMQAQSAETFQFEPRPVPQRRSIPLKTLDNDPTRKFVDVVLESGRTKRNVSMLVDTGAQITVIDQALAKDLGIQPEQYTLMTGVNSTAVGWVGRVSKLTLGSEELSNHLVAVSPTPGIFLLGMDVLDKLSLAVAPTALEFADRWYGSLPPTFLIVALLRVLPFPFL